MLVTVLLVIGLITFLLWLLGGVVFKALPGELVTACLILWIICAVGLLVIAIVGHGHLVT